MKIIEWVGGDAPSKQDKLTVVETEGFPSLKFCAFWEPGYCGCSDCHCLRGWGRTEEEAISDYWELWGDIYLDRV